MSMDYRRVRSDAHGAAKAISWGVALGLGCAIAMLFVATPSLPGFAVMGIYITTASAMMRLAGIAYSSVVIGNGKLWSRPCPPSVPRMVALALLPTPGLLAAILFYLEPTLSWAGVLSLATLLLLAMVWAYEWSLLGRQNTDVAAITRITVRVRRRVTSVVLQDRDETLRTLCPFRPVSLQILLAELISLCASTVEIEYDRDSTNTSR
jgi:hypothetical protein